MEKKDRNDELMELKEQMEVLKEQLHKSEIVEESQVAELVRSYKPRHRRRLMLCGAFSGFCSVGALICNMIEHYERWSWWAIGLLGIVALILIIGNAISYAGYNFEIKDEQLIVRNVLRSKVAEIPIQKIRFVEFLANKSNGARIMYNKYDEMYLRGVNHTELIKDILRVNPDIEIRRELA